ncbi:hypothetical protein J437_LFUL017367 [Ladona fulva]|uniref:Uncharacterized protein n=1 Tax=Ladona fulva TaxID=123851 RepID=A0A8K0KMN5_LADFU|nr:hypothetical protein J437_LFUL017367 [Ladona fulva]
MTLMTPMAAPGRLNFLGRSEGSKTSLRSVFRGGRQSAVSEVEGRSEKVPSSDKPSSSLAPSAPPPPSPPSPSVFAAGGRGAGCNSEEQTPLLQTEDSTEASEIEDMPASTLLLPPPTPSIPPPSPLPPPSPPSVPPPSSSPIPPSPTSSLPPPLLPTPLIPTPVIPAPHSPAPESSFPRSAPDLRVDFSEVEDVRPHEIAPPDINRLSAPSPTLVTVAVHKAPLLPDEHETRSVVQLTCEQQLQLRQKAESLLVDLADGEASKEEAESEMVSEAVPEAASPSQIADDATIPRDISPHRLPDLTSTMSPQEMRDFEMRYGSPHHGGQRPIQRHGSIKHRHRRHHSSSHRHPATRTASNPAHHARSQSVKASKKRADYLSLPHAQRSRVASMPNELGSSFSGDEEEHEEYYRLRHFSITGKGVVHNRGDSLKSRRSRSNNSVASSNSSHSTEFLGGAFGGICSYPGSARNSAEASLASSRGSSASGVAIGPVPLGGSTGTVPGVEPSAEPGTSALPYRVVMLGASGVGKTSLVSQFMTSEYMHAYDTSLDEEFGEKSVSVLLDGEESELTFIDHPSSEMSPENCISTYEAHAYVVVYSTSDKSSASVAEETLQCLWKSASVSTRAVILVGNKTDLVRSRVVSTEEGKSMATSYDCKFIETSVGIQHNVDELLVGILTQIRLKLEDPERSRALFRKRSSRRRNRSSAGAGEVSGSGSGATNKYRGSKSAGVTSSSLKMARGLLEKVWPSRCDSKSKSCENLHVL